MGKNNKEINEREVAVLVLGEVIDGRAYSNVALRRFLAVQGHFSRGQKAFVTEVVSGTLRNLLLIDHIIGSFSKTPIKRMKPVIVNILRSAVYQLKFMNEQPVFAICNEAVEMAKIQGFGGLSGFVNGVLRNIARSGDIGIIGIDKDVVAHLSLKFSTQDWIVRHFLDELGLEKTQALLENIMQPPEINICVNTIKTTTADLLRILEDEGVEVSAGILPNTLKLSKTSDLSGLQSFKSGLYHIMDTAAALAVRCTGIADNAHIIDLCAAPGGKVFLAAYSAGDKAKIVARDVHPHKIKLLKDGAKRLGLGNLTAELGDARVFDERLENTADLLILDMPCSGLGTLRRKADIKLNKTADSLDVLAEISREILITAHRYVKIGGKMLFCTCTISRAENEDNFNWILKNLPFRAVDFSDKLPQNWGVKTAKDGFLQVLPQEYGTDGFFISVLERIK
ncbi:MAG: 16S rRNA (cytosine(967)-C(5))-methyltransferase RsmB [Defluviitaleaceae bacterium]|nr:16S rRNA (cytosine(967)-C(5))-methyltransferase RsmB [Defluviitaleaceae bacterium]